MIVDAYDIETLRKIIRLLQNENKELKEKLKELNVPFENICLFEDKIEDAEEYDFDQAGRINMLESISDDIAKQFFKFFWGRHDVFAKRGKNGGYFPQCDNRWNEKLCPKKRNERTFCDDCANKKWVPLELWRIKEHLRGSKEDSTDVLGIYPLLPDGTCRFIVFDFDNHEKGAENNDYANKDNEWHIEVDALRRICIQNGISSLVERSRSGKGAHVWIFFSKPIDASIARNFGFLLLDKGATSINMKSFNYYDRLYPSQDVASSIGNLIALPLQGQALKNGNSAFVDENWNAYPNQWDALLNKTQKLTLEEIENFIKKWNEEVSGVCNSILYENRPKPWNKKCEFSKKDVIGKLHLVLSDGVYIDAINIMPRLQNQIRSMAAFDNPEYYKNKRLGYSNYYNFSSIYLGKDVDGYINVPRGLREKVIEECNRNGILFDILDQRNIGRPIRVSFNGSLKMQQDFAAQELLAHSDGVLQAATAFGKTVVCSYLISKRKVSTLILLQSKDLLLQWIEELNKFLKIDEAAPIYETNKGKKKKRESVIGILQGNKNTLTGIVDVAMIQSLSGKNNLDDILSNYGMIIMDECHHAASVTSMDILKKVRSKYVYGVSATLKRGDKLDKIIYMFLGPLRYKYTALERASTQGIGHYFIPRYTRVVDNELSKKEINVAYNLIENNEARNNMIINDVKECIKNGKTPLILTKKKTHARYLADMLQPSAMHVFILYGDNTDKENYKIKMDLKQIPKNESLILIATGQKVGEGFNFPRLDVLILASPISFDGRQEQYVGRLNRDYEGKEAVYVYDYVDSHMNYFDKMFRKRLKTYKKIGFSLLNDAVNNKQITNAIFDSSNYVEKFEQDLVEADKEIIISSPNIYSKKIYRLVEIVKNRQEKGVSITIITLDPDYDDFNNQTMLYALIYEMKNNGINVILKKEVEKRFAIIDSEIIWHGGMNLLGKEDVFDNLIRIKNKDIAAELLEIELKITNFE